MKYRIYESSQSYRIEECIFKNTDSKYYHILHLLSEMLVSVAGNAIFTTLITIVISLVENVCPSETVSPTGKQENVIYEFICDLIFLISSHFIYLCVDLANYFVFKKLST